MHTAAVTIHSALIGSCRSSAMPPTANAAPAASTTPETFLITPPPPLLNRRSLLRPAAASGPQPAQRLAVPFDQDFAVAVPPAAHDLHTRAPYAVDRLTSRGENPAVEDLVSAALDERRVGGREGDDIQRRFGRDTRRGRGACRGQRTRGTR